MAKQPTGMQVRVEKDEYGLPIVSWVEPRRVQKHALLIFSMEVVEGFNARCWIEIGGFNGTPLFLFQHDLVHNRPGMPEMSGTPLSNIAGFSLHTSTELYGDGATPLPRAAHRSDDNNYRDDLVLIADLKESVQPDIGPILPLTKTTASRSDVMALHATLTEVFLTNAEALKLALKARQEKRKRDAIQEKWKSWLKPPIISGGRKFVNLWDWNKDNAEPEGSEVIPVDAECKFELSGDDQQDNARFVSYLHFFERGRQGGPELVMTQNYFWICGPSDVRHPELIHYICTSIKGGTGAYKPRELFKAVRLFNGGELQLPQAYVAAPDVKIDASTLILCLEFSDGELMPLTHAPTSEKAGVEKLRGQLEHIFAGEGSGGGNEGGKIVL